MMTPTITVINIARTPFPDGLPEVIAAIQKQVTDYVAPIWNVACNLLMNSRIAADSWGVIVCDRLEQAEIEGYSELTHAGLPLARVPILESQDCGDFCSVVFSQAVLSMLVDPNMDQARDLSGITTAMEVCAPCLEQTYKIDSIRVSDFLFPAWFDLSNPQGVDADQFDFLRGCLSSGEVLPGGYACEFVNGTWIVRYALQGNDRSSRMTARHRHTDRKIPYLQRRRSL
jgi:hypothetical protein